MERNNVIHRGANFNTKVVIDRINSYLQWSTLAGKMTKSLWLGCKTKIQIPLPRVQMHNKQRLAVVHWDTPLAGWVKLNIDGSFDSASGLAGGGGVIRDSNGSILEGFTATLSATSSLEAELKSIEAGLGAAQKWGSNIWIETDALEAVTILGGGGRGAANLRHTIAAIRILMAKGSCRISHIYREGNRLADWLAKQAHNPMIQRQFNQDTAPLLVKDLAYVDRMGVPNIREIQEEGS